jgi:hypothetical protein
MSRVDRMMTVQHPIDRCKINSLGHREAMREAGVKGAGEGHDEAARLLCYKGVMGCCEGIAWVLRDWCKGGARVLQGCYKGVTRRL